MVTKFPAAPLQSSTVVKRIRELSVEESVPLSLSKDCALHLADSGMNGEQKDNFMRSAFYSPVTSIHTGA